MEDLALNGNGNEDDIERCLRFSKNMKRKDLQYFGFTEDEANRIVS
jgi:hypothetical protein